MAETARVHDFKTIGKPLFEDDHYDIFLIEVPTPVAHTNYVTDEKCYGVINRDTGVLETVQRTYPGAVVQTKALETAWEKHVSGTVGTAVAALDD